MKSIKNILIIILIIMLTVFCIWIRYKWETRNDDKIRELNEHINELNKKAKK